MAGAFVLLLVVLVPGIGYSVNGARRWIRLGVMNFRCPSWRASCCSRTWRATPCGVPTSCARISSAAMKPVGVLALAAVLLLAEPDFGAATVLLATGLAVLFLAGARLHHLAVPVVLARPRWAPLAVLSPYRARRLTGFSIPGAIRSTAASSSCSR